LLPAEGFPIILTIHRQAVLDSGLLRLHVGVPAELAVLALVIGGAHLVDGVKLAARCLEWPVVAHPAVVPVFAVLVSVARIILAQAHTDLFLALLGPALVLFGAVPAWKEVLAEAPNFLAVAVDLLTSEVRNFVFSDISGVHEIFVHPRVLSTV